MKIPTKTVTLSIRDASIIADILEQFSKIVEAECQASGIDRNDSECPEIDAILKNIEEQL
jgi:hypothetical protein